MPAAKGKIVEGGRVILPAAFRKSMGLQKGDTVLMELHGEEIRIRPARSALRRLQEKLRDYAPELGSVADELIAERRQEATKE
ncbi:AbrB/MazE/SpoVT family DNA-binding domain-containing protein [Aureimonas pseudogalii]|uniref:AbrB family looped-hinge helix DNA binding protein n=1 Tax=Aureimonas pseudogalii TaxID=1744844 RepID=A0A7W6H7W7_9HYPH|nr:AbrB/MazE/SpoVT family DNA-binding domain-containing protein [Aureimonas pseudogalii]MBB4000269.1 AbrB family looped-hinge helix DNA binding protein [Aureimonas pseudogalii]